MKPATLTLIVCGCLMVAASTLSSAVAVSVPREGVVKVSAATPAAVQVESDASPAVTTTVATAPEQDAVSTGAVSLYDKMCRDFVTAISGNALGWFCERYGFGNVELEAVSRNVHRVDFFRAVARSIQGLPPYDGYPPYTAPAPPLTPASVSVQAAAPGRPVYYTRPTYGYYYQQSCGPNGCGPSYGGRFRLFRRR